VQVNDKIPGMFVNDETKTANPVFCRTKLKLFFVIKYSQRNIYVHCCNPA